MKDSILKSFVKLEQSRKKILTFLATQDVEDLKQSKEGNWSMIQAMRHVQLSEDSIMTYMEKKMLAGDNMPDRTLNGRLRLLILFLVFFFRFKFKAPKMLADPSITSLGELSDDWDLSRERMKKFIDNYPEKWKSKAIYKHPAGMRINLLDTIQFFNVHLRHHIHQVHRIRKRLGS